MASISNYPSENNNIVDDSSNNQTSSLGTHAIQNLTGTEPSSPEVISMLESSSESYSPLSSLSVSSQSSTSRPETPPVVYASPVFTISPGSSSNSKIINTVMTLKDATFGDISETTTRDRATKQMARDFAGERSIFINDKPFFTTLQRPEGLDEQQWEDQKSFATEMNAELAFEYLKQTINEHHKTSNETELDLLTSKTLLAATQIGPHSAALQSFQFVKSKIPSVAFISNTSVQSRATITVGKNQLHVAESQKLRANDENGTALRTLDLTYECNITSGKDSQGEVSIRAKVHKIAEDQGLKLPKINLDRLTAAFNRLKKS